MLLGERGNEAFHPAACQAIDSAPSVPVPPWADAFPSVPDVHHLVDPLSPGGSDDLSFLDALLRESSTPTPDLVPNSLSLQQQQQLTVNECHLGQAHAPHNPHAAGPTSSHSNPLLAAMPQHATKTLPAGTAVPPNYDMLSSILFGEAAPPGDSNSPQPSPSAQASTTHHAPPPNMREPVTTGQPPAPSSLPTTAFDGLLDNPLNAALLTAQLPKPHRNTSKPSPCRTIPIAPLPTQPIAKPKRKKIRPNDRLRTLQAHLDTVTARLHTLSLQNRWLEKKHRVLHQFVQDLEHHEAVANQIQADVAHHKAHPLEPPRGAAVYQQWTPEQFIEFHEAQMRAMARIVVTIESATAPAAPAAIAPAASRSAGQPLIGCLTPAAQAALPELEVELQKLMQTAMFACYGRMDLMPQVMAMLGQSAALAMPEEEHWKNVVAAMDLTEGQVEEMLVAREVLLSIIGRMEQEQVEAQAAISQQKPSQAAGSKGWEEMVQLQEHMALRMSTLLRRHQSILLLLIMFICFRTLSPLQVAKAMLHAHPLMLEPIVVMNTLHAQHCQNSTTAPMLGPRPPAMATACTVADLMKGGQR